MASNMCNMCLRYIQHNLHPSIYTRCAITKSALSRKFSSTASRYVALTATAPKSKHLVNPVQTLTKPQIPITTRGKLAKNLQNVLGKNAETYTAYGATELLYKECARHATYKIPQVGTEEDVPTTEDGEDLGVGEEIWHIKFGLLPTFSTWSQVTMLHMYLIVVRFRNFETLQYQSWQQNLLDHFFYDAEDRMVVNHNMVARGTRNKYLKDLYVQWRGLLAAYDEGLVKGDAVLASAIWRNIYKANDDVDFRHLAQIVSFMRSSLQFFDSLPENRFSSAKVQFGSLEKDELDIRSPSPMMRLPFENASEKDLDVGKST